MKNHKKLSGFTLTEVMIGMMILAVAIVATTNLLIHLMRLNSFNVNALQAYYLAQEGIEGVRNIRDTNWLHNRDWLGAESLELWGHDLSGNLAIDLRENGWARSGNGLVDENDFSKLASYAPWILTVVDLQDSLNQKGQIYFYEDRGILSSENMAGGKETPFKRIISIQSYQDDLVCKNDDCVEVTSIVSFQNGVNEEKIELKGVFTNWQGGVF